MSLLMASKGSKCANGEGNKEPLSCFQQHKRLRFQVTARRGGGVAAVSCESPWKRQVMKDARRPKLPVLC